MAIFDLQLGDERLNSRAEYCFSRMQLDPALSFPQTFKSSKELQEFYRFIHNPRTDVNELKESVIEQTRLKLGNCKMAIAIHDTTLVKPTAKSSSIDEFKYNKSFFAHANLLVNPEDTKEIFCIGAVYLWRRLAKLPIRTTGEHARWLDKNISKRKSSFDIGRDYRKWRIEKGILKKMRK